MSFPADHNAGLRRSPETKSQVALFFLGLVVLWALVWLGVSKAMEMKPRTLWTSASRPPPPAGFAFLGFPASTTVKVFESAGGAEVGTLGRAVAMSGSEEAGEWVTVMGQGVVKRADLRLDPPDRWEALLEGYEKAASASQGHQFVGATLTIETRRGSSPALTFTRYMNNANNYSTYTVEGGRGRPQQLAVAGLGEALNLGCLLAPLLVGVGVSSTVFLWRRLKRNLAGRAMERSVEGA